MKEYKARTTKDHAVLLSQYAMRPTVVFLSRENNRTGQSTASKYLTGYVRAGEVVSALSLEGTLSHDSWSACSVVVKACSIACLHLEGSEKRESPGELENSTYSPTLHGVLNSSTIWRASAQTYEDIFHPHDHRKLLRKGG